MVVRDRPLDTSNPSDVLNLDYLNSALSKVFRSGSLLCVSESSDLHQESEDYWKLKGWFRTFQDCPHVGYSRSEYSEREIVVTQMTPALRRRDNVHGTMPRYGVHFESLGAERVSRADA